MSSVILLLLLTEVVLVRASESNAAAAATLTGLVAVVGIAAGTLVEASRRKRDRDNAYSKRQKTVGGYVSVFLIFLQVVPGERPSPVGAPEGCEGAEKPWYI